jgi:membrane protein DedA with SNARE-associated domain
MDVDDAARRAAGVLPEQIRPRSRNARLLAILLAALLVVVLVGTIGDAVADYFGLSLNGAALARALVGRPYLASVGLIAVEEAGVPLPISGDLLIMYSAARAGRQPVVWLALGLAFELAVLVGSSILFVLARRFGRRLLHGPVGQALHLNEERLRRAEGWFKRWGIWAVVVGRHVPGFRVAITVVAASFNLRYPVFIAGVAISSAIWVTVFFALGLLVGPRARSLIGAHQNSSLLVLGAAIGIGAVYVAGRLAWNSSLRNGGRLGGGPD